MGPVTIGNMPIRPNKDFGPTKTSDKNDNSRDNAGSLFNLLPSWLNLVVSEIFQSIEVDAFSHPYG